MLKISTARSTTQTSDASRRASSQIGQGDFSVNAPQVVQNWIFSRASRMVSARLLDDGGIRLDKMQRNALGGTRPDAGQLGERGDECVMDSGSKAILSSSSFSSSLDYEIDEDDRN